MIGNLRIDLFGCGGALPAVVGVEKCVVEKQTPTSKS